MSIFDRIFKQPEQPKAEFTKVTLPIQARYLERIAKDIKKWRDAQYDAEVLDYPDRLELMKIYKDLVDDSQIYSCMQIRTNKSTNGKIWVYDDKGEINEDLSKLFVDGRGLPLSWFRDFLIYAQMHKYYGNVCLQISKSDEIQVKQLPVENLIPQWEGFIWNIESGFTKETNFSRFDDKKYINALISIGDKSDLGLLNKCAPYMIWKEVFGSWSMHADIYGQPLRVGKTDIRDADRRKNMIDMLSGMSKSTYAVTDISDMIEFIASSGASSHQIYSELINACDQAISKILLGGTGIIDEKAFVGSAEIQNGILDDIILADKTDLQTIVNKQLIPRLQKIGFLPDGKYTVVWDMDETLSIKEWAAIIPQLAMAGYRMSQEDVENKLGIELDEYIEPRIEETPEKDLTQAISKMYNLYKDYE